jgi:hypothetical protein
MESSDRSRNILIGAVVLIIIVLVIIFVVRRRGTTTPVNSPLPTPVSSFEKDLQNNFGITVPDNAIKADLSDVSGGNQMGLATDEIQNSSHSYTVMANLDDPAVGYFYQAWLVKDNSFISLGKLELEKGGWLVNLTTKENLSDHKKVWVTLEKTFDMTPEKHILEGSF